MDHRSGSSGQSGAAEEGTDIYVTENGDRFRIPYRMIKRVTFNDLIKSDLVDLPHAARLQYRLMLLEPILKASVDFTRLKITIIYNPDTSDNRKEKISLDQIREVLTKEGITTDQAHTVNEDYDYYKNFYNYAYNPAAVRETAPYGFTMEQWRKLKPEWEMKVKRGEVSKQEKFKAFQEEYLEENPEMAPMIDPSFKPGTRKAPKKGGGSKGFWFHGI